MTTGGSTIPASPPARGFAAVLAGYWNLVRPRIVGMVLFSLVVAALASTSPPPGWTVVVHALVGSGLVIVGAIALNQRLERQTDARMPRTAARPLPSGRLSPRGVTVFGIAASAAGLVYLAVFVNVAIVALAALSWVIYVWVYTPLKMFTPWQTPIGAVAGAMPVLLGAAAAGGLAGPNAWTLFGVLYLWQFPHAMAIAWLYREQFAMAPSRVATVVDPSGRTAARIAVAGAAMLVPAGLAPVVMGTAGPVYGVVATAFGLAYLVPAVRFLARRDDATARTLLRVSFFHLPAVFIALLVAALV